MVLVLMLVLVPVPVLSLIITMAGGIKADCRLAR